MLTIKKRKQELHRTAKSINGQINSLFRSEYTLSTKASIDNNAPHSSILITVDGSSPAPRSGSIFAPRLTSGSFPQPIDVHAATAAVSVSITPAADDVLSGNRRSFSLPAGRSRCREDRENPSAVPLQACCPGSSGWRSLL